MFQYSSKIVLELPILKWPEHPLLLPDSKKNYTIEKHFFLIWYITYIGQAHLGQHTKKCHFLGVILQ